MARIRVLLPMTILAAMAVASDATAAAVFSDDFSPVASPLWNAGSDWSSKGGRYQGEFQLSFPELPFDLTDFTVEVDVENLDDGGIWLRSADIGGAGVGRTGVLLVTGGFFSAGSGLYWHVATGDEWGPFSGVVSGLFTPGVSDSRIRVEVSGDTYSAYVGNASIPATTLTTREFSHGRIALYDFSGVQSFDNILVTVPGLASDLNGDDDVDSDDLANFLENWTGDDYPSRDKTWQDGDTDSDGDIDSADIIAFLSNWTGALAEGSSVAAVPEPSSLVLIGLAGVVLFHRQRRAATHILCPFSAHDN